METVNAPTGPLDHLGTWGGLRPEPAGGVFETMLVVGGRPLELAAHLARMEASVAELFSEPLPTDARQLVLAAAADTELGRLRLDVAPGNGASVRVAPVDEALVFPEFSNAVELVTLGVPGGIGAHKWADRRLLEQAEHEAGDAVPLVLDSEAMLEGSRGNLFLVIGGILRTPPADGRLLPGITRAQVIEVARAAGIVVREEELPVGRLFDADEVFLTGAVRGVEPVRAARGVREWDEGELTPRIAAQLRALWFG